MVGILAMARHAPQQAASLSRPSLAPLVALGRLAVAAALLSACTPRPKPVEVLPGAQREELRYHIERIEDARRQGTLQPIEAELSARLAANPKDAAAQTLVAWASPDRNDAFAAFQAILRREPDSYWAHLGLGRAYLLEGVLRRAVPHMERAVELDGRLAAGHAWHGELLRRLDRRDEAMAAFQRAVERDARSVVARRGLGELYLAAGNAPGAIRELQHVAEQSPRDLALHLQLGGLLAAAGRPTEAMDSYTRATEINPNRASIWFPLGQAAVAAGDDARGEQALRRVLELSSEHEQARLALAGLLTRTDRPEEAIESYQTLLVGAPEHAAALRGLVPALRGGGRLGEALQIMLQLEALQGAQSADLDAELRRLGLDRTPVEGRTLQQVFDRLLKAVHACHAHLAGEQPATAGRLVVQVEISPEGRASSVTVIDSSASADIAACVDWLVRMARFPAGHSAGVTFPVPLPGAPAGAP